MVLHAKYQSSLPSGFRQEDAYVFRLYDYVQHTW